ncbi:hypothetical protein [Paracoccus tibetensis]|uniref:Phage holin, lambda family n=1 Tax=Paracoccus tibetensis TaxID=336292 RepID=A0A1G5BD82_9RHOB|nr:hypothetical protein [Paracoccus tibetensis]SCX88128.1 hypothetical protein SAMN05660710_00098 [Paracoccus tibetensis]
MPDDPQLWWRAAANARSPEVWAGILAGMIYVYNKSPLPARGARAAEAMVSGLLAYATGEWVAAWAGVHEAIAVILLASLGYLILDVARSLVADRQILKEILIKRLGGRNG